MHEHAARARIKAVESSKWKVERVKYSRTWNVERKNKDKSRFQPAYEFRHAILFDDIDRSIDFRGFG